MLEAFVWLAEQLGVNVEASKVDIDLYTAIATQIEHKNMEKLRL